MKRVPLNFDWPLGKTWHGYHITFCLNDNADIQSEQYCEDCKQFAKLKGLSFHDYGCPDFNCGPPVGSGFQLWDTSSCGGKPVSPVFDAVDPLCEWCASNAYIFANNRITAEQWKLFFC